MNIITIAIITLLLLNSALARAQERLRFADEISASKAADSVQFPAANAILFIGSSSLNMWKDINLYFPGYPIINRGFGGSVLTDVIDYEKEIIVPYHPKQVFVYCGENDVADGVSADSVYQRFVILFSMLRNDLPKAQISFISMKPGPARWNRIREMKQGNAKINTFLSKNPNTRYIDVLTPMLNEDGSLRTNIYLNDGIHMNADDYKIWQKAIAPYLMKNL